MPDTSEDRKVEDVLSSVRRLVSGELAGAQRRRSTPQALVLTPRQRISEARRERHTGSLEERIAELEAQLAFRSEEYEPDGSEDQAAHRPTEPIILAGQPRPEADPDPLPLRPVRRLSRIEPVDAADARDETRSGDALTVDTAPSDEDGMSDAAAYAADAETTPHAGTDRPRETGVSEAPDTGQDVFADAALTPAPSPEIDADLVRAVAQSVDAAISDIAASAAEDVAEGEDPASDLSDTLETASDLNARLEAVAPEEPRHMRLDRIAPEEPHGEGAAPAATPAKRPAPASERLEGDLRDLVGDLIREELQGELGARITRNVRKLVRREIQRALAARDLS